MLFMGDNGETDAAYEGIFPLLQDGLKTTSWGTSLFLLASTYDADMHANPNNPTATNGTDQAWGGNRARPDLVKKFFPNGNVPNLESYATAEAAGDDRALFNGVNRTLDNDDVSTFKSGFGVAKFTNFKTDGSAGHDATFPDADFFLMRVAEAYLNFAEADARLDNGETDAAYEGIFPLLQDGLKTTSWGTSLFLLASTYDADMHANPNNPTATNGTDQAWGGNRARPDLVKKFFPNGNVPNLESYATAEAAGDDRALFNGVNRTLDNDDVSTFKSGFGVAKFTNFKTDGSAGHDATFPDADFFLMRVAEAYLNFEEGDGFFL